MQKQYPVVGELLIGGSENRCVIEVSFDCGTEILRPRRRRNWGRAQRELQEKQQAASSHVAGGQTAKVLNGADYVLQGTFGQVWKYFFCHRLG